MDDNKNQQNQEMKDKAALYDFVAELLHSRPDMKLTPEEEPLVMEQLVKELDYTINAHLMDLLTDEAVEEFNKLLDTDPSTEQINEFLSKHIPNLSGEVASAMIEFRTVFMYEADQEESGREGNGKAHVAVAHEDEPSTNMTGSMSKSESEDTPPPAPTLN